MSWETQSWAAKQRPGSASAKLVLLGLASCADANHCAHPSIQWLCDFSDLNRKTVITALQRLEDGMFPLIEDTGHRVGRTGQVKVYRLGADEACRASGLASDPASETVPKPEQFQKRNSSVSSRKQSQKRDTEPFLEPIPPLSANADKTPAADFEDGSGKDQAGEVRPAGKRGGASSRGTRLADDWTPPDAADLPPMAHKLVEQWPSGAYQAVCETFRCHWHSETRAIAFKRDWDAALAKWLINDHSKIMRDAKAGVSFAGLAPARPAGDAPARQLMRPVAAKAKEDDRSKAIHDVLRQELGAAVYDRWIAHTALIHDAPGVMVIADSEFVRSWIEDRFQQTIMAAARAALGAGVRWVRFHVEQSSKGEPNND